NIKETRLLHLPPSPINAEEMESHRTAQSQGFFEPSTFWGDHSLYNFSSAKNLKNCQKCSVE
ncbi:hypothetical protein, partial [Acetobacter estunensis]|uniref:hypothetical protein n=1 Tax=Acetobacter estunensis TaxID=104097 RepID=UPI001F55420D